MRFIPQPSNNGHPVDDGHLLWGIYYYYFYYLKKNLVMQGGQFGYTLLQLLNTLAGFF
jgi:hypothetical protein